MNSTEVKHTPGPWALDAAQPGLTVWAGEDAICECYDADRSDAEAEANARLIAAAPDLLAALRPFAEEPCDHDHQGPLCPREVARLAIIKAEGGV